MLQQLSDQVRECLRRAAEAKARADATTEQASKKSYSDLESSWLFLARSYMFAESLQDFVDYGQQRKKRLAVDPTPPIAGQLFDLLPVAIYVCDASGLIVYYNSHAAKLWGRSPSLDDPTDRFCGSCCMHHLNHGPIAHPDCPMVEVLRSGKPVQNREIVVERADGSRGVVLANINPFKDRSGKLLGAVNCFQDVTERKRSERQIAASVVEKGKIHRDWNAQVLASQIVLPAVAGDMLSAKDSYRVVFQTDGRDIQTLYWSGSLEETRRLAAQIAIRFEADAFRIFDFTDAEVSSEKRPFQD